MNERDLTTAFMRGCRSIGFHAARIPDAGAAERFTSVKPYDLCMCSPGGQFHAIELKIRTSGLSWPLSSLQPHQEAHLLAAERCDALSWLIIGWHIRLSQKERAKRGHDAALLREVWALRIQQVIAARLDEARTGLQLDWIQEHGVLLPWLNVRGEDGSRVHAVDPRPLAPAEHTPAGGSSGLSPTLEDAPAPSPLLEPRTPPLRARTSTRTSRSLDLFRPLDQESA